MTVRVAALAVGALIAAGPLPGAPRCLDPSPGRLGRPAPWGGQSAPAPRAVEREWTLRRWVLGSDEEVVVEVRDALQATQWELRVLALDALERAASVGAPLADAEWVPAAVRVALADEHPDVRSSALEVLSAQAPGVRTAELPWAQLVADPRATVRAAAAGALRGPRDEAAAAWLVQLARDPERAVARAARLALFDPTADVVRARSARVQTWRAIASDEERLQLALAWARGGTGSLLLDELEAAAPRGDSALARDRRAVLAALRARSPEGLADPRRALEWLDGWFAGETYGRQELFGVCAGGAGPVVAHALLKAARAVDRAAPGAEVRGFPGLARDLLRGRATASDALYLFAERAIDAAGAQVVLEDVAQSWSSAAPWSDAGAVEVLTLAGPRMEHWTRELVTAWSHAARSADVRRAALDALAEAVFRRDDEVAGAQLVRWLASSSSELSQLAFRALCDAPSPARYAAALHRAWRAADDARRLELLAHTPRDRALAPFRTDLLALGAQPGVGRARAVEHLEVHTGDDGVRTAFEAWLADDLRHAALDRAAAGRASALVRALHRVDPVAAVPSLERALRSEVPAVSEAAARALGHSAAGRAVLRAAFEELGSDPGALERTRIEAALALAEEHAPAERALIEELGGAPGDLRSHMIFALGKGGAQAREYLLRAARDPAELGAGSGLQARAVEAIAARLELDVLVDLARSGATLEAQRAAILALGQRGTSQAAAVTVLLELMEELGGLPATAPDPAAEDDRELLREALLVALAETGTNDEAVRREALRAPARAAAEQLAARFRGKGDARVAFRWRGELALAGAWAQRGRLGELLAAAGPAPGDWIRLDARLLLALSEVGEPDALAAWRLARAAAVGLVGEDAQPSSAWTSARGQALALARRADQGRAAAALARGLLADRRGLVVSDAGWEELARRLGCAPRELDEVLSGLAR